MRTTLLSSVIALSLLGLGSAPAHAQQPPLAGAAYRIAEDAYASYARGDYQQANRQAAEAARLRPDVTRLRLLQIYALQKLGRDDDARAQARRALADGLQDPALPGLAAATTTASRAAARAGGAPTPRATAHPSAAEQAYRRAFALATQAYAAYNAGRMAEAAGTAEQAFRQQPQQGAWALLWVSALETQGDLEAARQAATAALALGAPNRSEMLAARVRIERAQASAAAQLGEQALAAQRPEDAIAPARTAVQLVPDDRHYRLLLMRALLLGEHLQDGVAAASAALAQDGADTDARVMRGYMLQRLGRDAQANADFDAALGQAQSDPQQRRNVRLLAVDAAVAAGDRARAERLLAPLRTDARADTATGKAFAAAVAERERALRNARPGQALTQATYPAPVPQCRQAPDGGQCALLPADLQDEGGAAGRAYAAYARQDYPAAIDDAREAVRADPDSAPLQALLTTALAAGDRTQQAEARQRLDTALAATPDDAGLLMQRGYLAQRIGAPRQALADFRAADATGKAPPTVVLDQAYASAADGDRRQAAQLLRTAIDRADAGQLPLDATQREATRQSIAEVSREWGVTVAAGYRGARQAATNLGGAAVSTPGDSVFSTLEAFWRPAAFNDRHGTLEAYARLANTLYDQGGTYESLLAVDPCTGEATADARDRAERLSHSRSVAGWPSTVGSLGLRYAFAQNGLSVGIERRQFLGSGSRRGGVYADAADVRCRIQTRSERPLQVDTLARYRLDSDAGGWMTYLTYGFYHGTGLRTDTRQWWTVSGYAQAGYSWDDNRARFSVDSLDDNGDPAQRLSDSDGRLRRQQTFAAAELRAGRSYRVGAEQAPWVLTPYLVVGADWLDQRSRVSGIVYPALGAQAFALSDTDRSWSLGAGPGAGVRYWFRADHYNAARSYLDLTVQYRFALGGGDAQRAKGLFATATLSY